MATIIEKGVLSPSHDIYAEGCRVVTMKVEARSVIDSAGQNQTNNRRLIKAPIEATTKREQITITDEEPPSDGEALIHP